MVHRQRRRSLVALFATCLGAFCACDSFGTEDVTPPTDLDGSVDTSPALDGAVAPDAAEADAARLPPECIDTSEPAAAFCPKQAFCADFSDNRELGEVWAEIDVAGGTAELGPGNPGRGLRSRISTGDGRARLFRSIAPGTVHVDFDLQTKKPAFASDDSWLDLLLILPRRTASGSGIGLEWTPAGLHLFTPGSPGFFVPYPSTCAWVHVHMSVRLTDVAVGEVSLSFNGEQVLEEAGIATQGEAPESPVIAIGGQARNVSSTADILYDNISISSAP